MLTYPTGSGTVQIVAGNEWVEFKENNTKPQEIGEYISALANSAVLESEASAYLVWGIRDRDHAVVGTTFKPHKTKVGNEQLENWLLRLLEPKIDFHFYTMEVDTKPVVLLKIECAKRHPVHFSGIEYVRVGSYTKKTQGCTGKRTSIMANFRSGSFEDAVAAERPKRQGCYTFIGLSNLFQLAKNTDSG